MPNIKWGATSAVFALVISVLMGLIFGVSVFYIFLRGIIFAAVFFGAGFGLRFVISHFFPEILLKEDVTAAQQNEQPGSHINITLDSTGEYAVPELYKIPDNSDGMGNIDDLISGVFKPKKSVNGKKAVSKPSDEWFDISSGDGGAAIDRMNNNGYNDNYGEASGVRTDSFQETSVFESLSSKTGIPSADTKVFEEMQFSPSFGDDSGLGGLPDLDMMARAFSSAPGSVPASQASAPAIDVPSFSSAPSMAQYFKDDDSPLEQDNAGNKPQPLEGDYSPKDIARGISTLLNKN